MFLTIIWILIGWYVSFIISKYYYWISIRKKELTAIAYNIDWILDDLNKEIKEKLLISYSWEEINNMYQIKYIIANTWDFAISNIINPLKLEIPFWWDILDFSIVHIEPDLREVSFKVDKVWNTTFIVFNFQLLNPWEYFIFKALIKWDYYIDNEYNKRSNFNFTLTCEDLPPKIESINFDFQYFSEYDFNKKSKLIEYDIYFIFFILILILVVIFYPSIYIWFLDNSYNIIDYKIFFKSINLTSIILIFNYIFIILITLIFFLTFSTSIVDKIKIKFKRKSSFKLSRKHIDKL